MLDKVSSSIDARPPAEPPERALATAMAASLVHVSDAEPGLRRKRTANGFRYIDIKGKPVSDRLIIERINTLVIPPAWEDVWICADPDGHIQVTGRDLRGRKQYRYHPRWSATREDVKYSSLVKFAQALPALRGRIDQDLRKRGLPRERVLASVVWLLDNTMIRVGNAVYARENKSFGLTTLRSRHVAVDGAKLRFAFKGKSGKEWRLQLVDRRMAKVMRSIQDLPGQHLFQFLDEDGERRRIGSQDVNAYLREASGADFSSKHFRTWGGTVRALTLFADTPLPETKAATARAMNEIIDAVANHLGNTRSVCRKCYIHPQVMASWLEGTLPGEIATAKRSRRRRPDGLDEEEMLVLNWLTARKA